MTSNDDLIKELELYAKDGVGAQVALSFLGYDLIQYVFMIKKSINDEREISYGSARTSKTIGLIKGFELMYLLKYNP